MVKEIVEPMFASMLPGPLATLRFVKLDLGHVPLQVSEVDVHKVDNGGIKLDMYVKFIYLFSKAICNIRLCTSYTFINKTNFVPPPSGM